MVLVLHFLILNAITNIPTFATWEEAQRNNGQMEQYTLKMGDCAAFKVFFPIGVNLHGNDTTTVIMTIIWSCVLPKENGMGYWIWSLYEMQNSINTSTVYKQYDVSTNSNSKYVWIVKLNWIMGHGRVQYYIHIDYPQHTYKDWTSNCSGTK